MINKDFFQERSFHLDIPHINHLQIHIFLRFMKHLTVEFDSLENNRKRSFMAYSYVAALTGLVTHVMFPDDFVRPRVSSDVTLKIHVVSLPDVLRVK